MASHKASSTTQRVLIIGSGPNATEVTSWHLPEFDKIVVINNAWRVTQHWTDMVYPYDFPIERLPKKLAISQRLIDETHFVPSQNHYGGFVYAGGTMAYTAAYWALKEYAPTEICFIGCDMHYPEIGPTHFYGTGAPDPLREDISLTSLEGSSARFLCLAARQSCVVFNLSNGPSRLIFPRKNPHTFHPSTPLPVIDTKIVEDCLQTEKQLGYFVADGRYWLAADQFNKSALEHLNKRWLMAAGQA